MKQIPNLFTLLNLVFGCIAITFIMQNGLSIQYAEDGSQFAEIPPAMAWGSLFIALAAVVDFLDGFVARWLHATSEMGKQLDSLADVVSFGAAPSLILFQLLRRCYAAEAGGIEVGLIWLFPAFIFAAAAAYRLAKFNLSVTQTFHFEGVPTPAAGLLVASLPVIYLTADNDQLLYVLLNKWVVYGFILFLSFLMVSRWPMLSLKMKSKKLNEHLPQLLLLIIGLITSFLFAWLAVPIIFIAYIILSLLFIKKSS
jgi:CDP-diacylglycerol--serine O-phosphatidyltransferase